MMGGASTDYFTTDGLGSISEITNEYGGLEEYYTYDAYGSPSLFDGTGTPISTSAVNNPFYFTGREYDFETGIYYYRARYYDPALGRFLETDPLGYIDSPNLYAYVGNNPRNWVDPWGLVVISQANIPGTGVDTRIGKLGEIIIIGTTGIIIGILGGTDPPGTGTAIGPKPPIVAPGIPEKGKEQGGEGSNEDGKGNSSGSGDGDSKGGRNESNSSMGPSPDLGPLPELGPLPDLGPLPGQEQENKGSKSK